MQKFQDAVLSVAGRPVSGASVLVKTRAGATATIYSDNGTTLAANPLTTDSTGEFSFYAANGRYDIEVSGAGLTTETRADVTLFDPEDANVVSVASYGAKADGATDDAPAIQAAIDYVETLGGGQVLLMRGVHRLQSTININSGCGVHLVGCGGDGIHDGGTGARAATILRWHGAAGGTVLYVASPIGASNSLQYGTTVRDLKIECGGVAGIGIEVVSVRNAAFERIFVLSPTIAAVKTSTHGNASMAEASDTQRCTFDRVSWRCLDSPETRAAHGLWLTSHAPATSNANTSLNYFTQCDGQNWGGAGSGRGVFLEDADNNTFMNLRLYRVGTTVEAVRLVGNPFCDANHFWNLSAGGANGITIRGTASGMPANPVRNSFWCVDVSNGTQYPTADAGVRFGWHSDNNVFARQLANKLVVADSDAQAMASEASLSSSSAYVFNGSSNHVRLVDGTNDWGLNIDGATGDLRINRLGGSGAVNVGAGVSVKIGNKLVSEGAADSGGTGFRVLRVPN